MYVSYLFIYLFILLFIYPCWQVRRPTRPQTRVPISVWRLTQRATGYRSWSPSRSGMAKTLRYALLLLCFYNIHSKNFSDNAQRNYDCRRLALRIDWISETWRTWMPMIQSMFLSMRSMFELGDWVILIDSCIEHSQQTDLYADCMVGLGVCIYTVLPVS